MTTTTQTEELRHIGAQMANAMFNLAQSVGITLNAADCAIFDKLRKEWDAATLRAPVAEGAQPVAWFTNRTKDGKRQLEDGCTATNKAYTEAHKEWEWQPLYTAPQLPDAERQAIADAEAASLSSLVQTLDSKCAELERELQAKQAQIDRLMLEHCPNEMTPEQMAEWGKHQRAEPPTFNELSAADRAKLEEGK